MPALATRGALIGRGPGLVHTVGDGVANSVSLYSELPATRLRETRASAVRIDNHEEPGNRSPRKVAPLRGGTLYPAITGSANGQAALRNSRLTLSRAGNLGHGRRPAACSALRRLNGRLRSDVGVDSPFLGHLTQ